MDKPAHDKSPNGAVRALRLVEALAGHEVFGLRLTDLAHTVGAPAPQTLRDLQLLAVCGWAEQKDDGKWRLAGKPIQVATQFFFGLRQAQTAVAEVERNYTRNPA